MSIDDARERQHFLTDNAPRRASADGHQQRQHQLNILHMNRGVHDTPKRRLSAENVRNVAAESCKQTSASPLLLFKNDTSQGKAVSDTRRQLLPEPAVSSEDHFENMVQDDFDRILVKKRQLFSFGNSNIMRPPHCRVIFYLTAGVIVLLILYATMNKRDASRLAARHGSDASDQKKVRVDVYMESQCPDTSQFIDSQLMPVWNELKSYMDLSMVPFGKARWNNVGTDDYSFQCQHGPKECLVNQLMCCAIDRLKTVDRYLSYIACAQGTYPGEAEQTRCDTEAGLDITDMRTCANGKEGRRLHKVMGEKTKEQHLFFVPWVVIDGRREQKAHMDFKTVLCQKLANKGVKPSSCSDGAVADSRM